MLNNISIGTYLPYNSIIHRLNPLSKILSLVILLIGIFLINDLSVYLVTIFLVLCLVKIAKLSIISMFKQLKLLFFMFIFLFIINIFMIKNGQVLFTFFNISIYSGAIYQSLLIFFRLMSMVFLSSILTMTTKPLDLTLGIEQMFKPLKKIGFPAHEIAMMISIALRFIPTLVEETNKIMIAQTSRGVDFQSNKIKVKIKAVIALLIPLFVASFNRAEDLANAMEARGYNPSAVRTRFISYQWLLKDTITLVISLIFVGVNLWLILTK